MIFQKTSSNKSPFENQSVAETAYEENAHVNDEVETVVGPSVNVEGDFASEGNIVVKGTVAGSVTTSRHLSVEQGAKIMANVRAGSARIAGEVKGNMKVREALELTSTARIIGDIEVKILVVEAGALIAGKVSMPGLETAERGPRSRSVSKKSDETTVMPSQEV
jgi:cytoskeletal protein CcmA (bactofilin family)